LWLQLFRNHFSVEAFRITEHGRMLFPRAWGRDPCVTFQEPERLEGQTIAFRWWEGYNAALVLIDMILNKLWNE